MRLKKDALAGVRPAVRPDFPQTGFVRLTAILAPIGPIPVGRTTWWEGVKTGRYPKPLKLGPRITVWKAEDIHQLMVVGADIAASERSTRAWSGDSIPTDARTKKGDGAGAAS